MIDVQFEAAQRADAAIGRFSDSGGSRAQLARLPGVMLAEGARCRRALGCRPPQLSDFDPGDSPLGSCAPAGCDLDPIAIP
jgi:hypothetical protein